MSYSEAAAAWQKMLGILKGDMSSTSYNTWFANLKLHAATEDKLIIVAESQFNIQHIRQMYYTTIYNAVALCFGRTYELEFVLKDELNKRESEMSASLLNPKYTFDSFVVGQSNRFAHAASLAVAEQPGDAYNPLFIYGGVGLGKTHLMNAIAHFILDNDPKKKILFITSENFVNELIDAIAKKKNQELRDKLRTVDVLMVDDVQFLSNKDATQEEFFHTFNALYEVGKQIILSSDRPPHEIPTLEERLRSRFMSGLIVDIQKPDYETRIAILQKKAENEGIQSVPEVLDFIADKVDTNIRELEGSLIRVKALADLEKTTMSVELAAEALKNITAVRDIKRITPEVIMGAVAENYGISTGDLVSSRRSREVAVPRQIAMYLTREMTNLSTTRIGEAFGGRDHTTVMHACDKISELVRRDGNQKKRIDEITLVVRER